MNRPTGYLALAFAAGLGLAGCAATTFADLANLSDPRTVVDESVNGQSVTVRNGRVLVVHLPVTTGDGNRWELVPLAATPLRSPIRIDYMTADGLLQPVPPFSGAMQAFNRPGATQPSIVLDASKPAPLVTEGVAVVRVRGLAPGNATVQLDYRRADVPGAPPTKSVRFDVTVL